MGELMEVCRASSTSKDKSFYLIFIVGHYPLKLSMIHSLTAIESPIPTFQMI